uniref:Uncharacterized protein AlNc14C21G2191 n=1 Tax=Albugo laibachii Nc14 TaxID=890382 RepID=F0W5M6_9STRA|nr:conserved hypothetical protein [Albugo laibachii Nc14]|eukprot:CCA16417.1 conserved hypothetical protein [Albugo laibachii Nc14]
MLTVTGQDTIPLTQFKKATEKATKALKMTPEDVQTHEKVAEFILKTTNKHRKKNGISQDATSPNTSFNHEKLCRKDSNTKEEISLRPRTMFGMKGRGKNETLEGSPYRPQWSKDGDGFVSNSKDGSNTSKNADNANLLRSNLSSGKKEENGRRKSKVLRYIREELLAMHIQNTTAPTFPSETVVISEYCLPPVGTFPFDHEEIYKQWALNKNRGRGRGRGMNTGPQERGQNLRNDSTRYDSDKKPRSTEDLLSDDPMWDRDLTDKGSSQDIWDDVGASGEIGMDMDLTSMAEVAERFRREMDVLRDKNGTTQLSHIAEASLDDLDLLDKKLEAVASGQFDDYKEESPEPEVHATDQAQESITSEPTLFESENALLKHDLGTGIPLNFMSAFSVPDPQPLEAADEWFYLDPQGQQQGPFKTSEMREWFDAGYFKPHLPIRSSQVSRFTPLANHFAPSEVPFASVPKLKAVDAHVDFERQHLFALKQQHLAQIQQEQRLLQMRRNDEIRDNPQVLDPPLQHQSHILQQQQQQMLLHQHVQEQNPISSQLQWPQHPQKATDGVHYLFPNSFDGGKLIPQGGDLLEQQAEGSFRPNLSIATQASMTADLPKGSTTSMESSFPLHEDEKKSKSHAWGENNARRTSTLLNKLNDSTQSMRRSEDAEVRGLHHQLPGCHAAQENTLRVDPEKEQQSKMGEKGTSSAWVYNNVVEQTQVKSLKEIQDEEKRAMVEQNRTEQSSMNLAQMGAQLKMMLGIESTNSSCATSSSKPMGGNASAASPWNTATTASTRVSSKQSLRDILAEEERLAQERAQQQEVAVKTAHWSNVVAGKPNATISVKSSKSLGPVPGAVLKSSSQARLSNTNSRGQSAHISSSRLTSDETGDASFWNFDAAQSVVPSSDPRTLSTNSFGSKALVPELMTWCAKELEQIGGVKNLTLMEYCATLDDPGEIREYLAAYLGSTPRVSAFATGFIQKKKEVQNPKYKKAPEDVPVDGVKPTNTSNTIGKKGRRRSKGQRVDPSLLSYSVGSV